MHTDAKYQGLFLPGRDPWRFVAALGIALPLFLHGAAAQDLHDETGDPAWSGSISVRAMSRLTQYGLDAAPERVTLVAGGTVSHTSGWSLGLTTAMQPGPWSTQRTSLSGEYEISLTGLWSLGLSLTRSWYPSGSSNPLASSPTSTSLAVSYDGDAWSFGADLDRYWGGEGATYASVDGSVFIAGNGYHLLPMLSLSFGSQAVTATALKRARGRNTTLLAAATTVTGLSSIDGMLVVIVPLGEGWSASAMPGLIYTPSDLASSSTRFTWSLGVRKSL